MVQKARGSFVAPNASFYPPPFGAVFYLPSGQKPAPWAAAGGCPELPVKRQTSTTTIFD